MIIQKNLKNFKNSMNSIQMNVINRPNLEEPNSNNLVKKFESIEIAVLGNNDRS